MNSPLTKHVRGATLLGMAKKKNPAAVELGRKGGKARAAALTPEQRKASASKAGRARWQTKGD